MLKIEVEIFSGRPNPQWIITDREASKRILGTVSEREEVLARPGQGYDGLGFREIRVTNLEDEPGDTTSVPHDFALASLAARDVQASVELALKVLDTMEYRSKIHLVAHDLTPLTAELHEMIRERIHQYLKFPPIIRCDRWPPYNPLRTTVADARCRDCEYEVSQFNPDFWNVPAVRPYNNCYNYARNWRTDTFAQPGRAHGAMYTALQCAQVSTAAMADGLVPRCRCLPVSEWPRRLMALVVDPGWDYHWYREQRGNFWGHKPGSTAARNTDNSNQLITDPETCDRGGYTDFCGYYYAGRSVVIN